MARPRRRHPALAGIDEAALAEFRAGIRRRYTDEQILEQLRASAERLGRSPTMREFAADPEAGMHPQTVIEHFGTWNAAKRAAGLTPRRFISRDELLEQLRQLGEELGRTADGQGPRREPPADGVEVADLAHVRVAQRRAAGGRASTCRSVTRSSSARSTRGPRSRGSSGGCRRWPTGRRRGGAIRR